MLNAKGSRFLKTDPDIEYYYNKSFSPTTLLRKLIKDLDKNRAIFEVRNKIDYIGNIATLINQIIH